MFISKKKVEQMQKDIDMLKKRTSLITEMYTQEILSLTNDIRKLDSKNKLAEKIGFRKFTNRRSSPKFTPLSKTSKREQENGKHFLEIIRLQENKLQKDFSKDLGFLSLQRYQKVIHYYRRMNYHEAINVMKYLKDTKYNFEQINDLSSFKDFMKIINSKGGSTENV